MDAPNPEDNGDIFRAIVQSVERKTRDQSENPEWFDWRRFRITASIAHAISHSDFANGRADTLAETYVRRILGEGPDLQNIDAITWGIENEAEAVRKYRELKITSLGRRVLVWRCGFFIDQKRAWLGATPDRIMEDEETEKFLCLEVFCPYKHREKTVNEACLEDRAFCLELGDESQKYRLKTNHKIYTQVQCQMGVTGIHRADLAVFTKNDIEIVPVTFNPEFWNGTVAKLEIFYREFLRKFPNLNLKE